MWVDNRMLNKRSVKDAYALPKTEEVFDILHVAKVFMKSTVNSEIFSRVLFSRNFAYAKFHENKILAKWRNHSVVYCYR